MYTNNVLQDTNSNKGIGTYKDIREVYELDIVQRQSGKFEDQRVFRDILLRLREGESVLNDWKILAKRFEEKLTQTERDQFSDAAFLLTKWADVDRVNIEMLRRINRPVAKIEAVHTRGREAKRATTEVAKGLELHLLIAKGSRVMLTANIWTEAGLVNRSMGIVKDIFFEEQGPLNLPKAVFITFEKYDGPTITNSEGDKVVLITPIKRSWEDKNRIKCSRLQLPICLAWAITVHKSQGLTLPKAKINIENKEFKAGLLFVTV